MRILFVLGGLRVGGYELLSVRLANELHRRGNRVAVVSLHSDDVIRNMVDPAVEVRFVTRTFAFDVAYFWRLARVFKACRPDIVVCCAFFEYVVSKLSSFLLFRRPRFVLAFHQTQPYGSTEEKHFRIGAYFARPFDDQYVAIHGSQIDYYCERFGLPRRRFTLIHNGVDTGQFAPGARDGRGDGNVFRIVHVANLKPLKDQWTLLESMVALDKECDDWELTIAGNDQEHIRTRYEAFVRKHGLTSKVRFVGSVSDTRSVLKDADVFLLTSVTEALPVAVIEAIAMGIPCIVTDVGGNSDIIEHGREGFLVQPGDRRAIVEHIKYLKANPRERSAMGAAARNKAIAHFDFSLMVDGYHALFERVLRV